MEKKTASSLLALTLLLTLAVPSCAAGAALYNALSGKGGEPTGEIEASPAVETSEDAAGASKQEDAFMNNITVSFGGHSYAATLEDNVSAAAFVELLESKGGAMTIHMSEYGGWEKVGSLGQTLPSSDTQTTTAAGDFVLYSSSQIVLFYGSNSWSYTRLGRLDDPSGLRDALGGGDVEITFALAE